RHKAGHDVFVLSRGFLVRRDSDGKPIRLVGTHVDITERKKSEAFNNQHAEILEMIAVGRPASEIYDAIALMYESRHPGLRCSMLELSGNILLHGGAPSLPKAYCEAVHGLRNGPNVGSCGTSTFTGKRVLVENIETDPKWADIKHFALPHGMRCCWSEPIKNSSGKVLGAFGMYYNHPALPNEQELKDLISAARLAGIVMERDQAQKRIRALAYTDELTGLASRASFIQHMEEIMKTSDRYNRRFGLLYIDLDNFKWINDSLGHDAGDALLKTIATRLRNTCRDTDFIARLGGDEFCVLVEEIEADYAANVAKRCLAAIAEPIVIYSRNLTPGCSIGIAYYPDDGNNPAALLKAADTSLYTAKSNGKNQYAFYCTELTRKAHYRFQIEQNLKEAIATQQLTLVYQPQVNVITGEIFGVEALSRWHHPQIGSIPPSDFIATAERIGMIKSLTEWVLRTACQQLIVWQTEGFHRLRMAVNISPSLFLETEFVSLVQRIVQETGIKPSQLKLEVTEGVVQTDPRNLAIFQDLKALGVLLAIDDFGSGYSSFASLNHLKTDYLKIDKYFIDKMITDQKAFTLVNTMIEMGHKLGYGIIAEGVETLEQLSILRSLNCEIVQGYLFSQPVSAAQLSVLLQSDKHKMILDQCRVNKIA
ncbi:MAG TPA: EAL domain-containing protein, partial [Nitrosomonas sp.]|nr:EAL domain-containing protein [Nitrosomonas sp.]HNM01227.1 EAL domain-containing protein [Nitrosomonas sp.]HNM73673.1 EAL domain-containing protein [Nitrosomonas sp.]